VSRAPGAASMRLLEDPDALVRTLAECLAWWCSHERGGRRHLSTFVGSGEGLCYAGIAMEQADPDACSPRCAAVNDALDRAAAHLGVGREHLGQKRRRSA
jgi:hypothetical protein